MNGMITVGAESYVTFIYNYAEYAGAIWLSNGTLMVDSEANLRFSHNSAGNSGGAVLLDNGKLIVNANANLNFSNSSAVYGGALQLRNSIAHVDTDGIQFYNNTASWGGAMFFAYGTMYINTNKCVKFITAIIAVGAIFIETGINSSIIVGKYSKLFLFNNLAL